MVLLSMNVACSNPPRASDTTGSPTSPTAETGAPPGPALTVACEPTDNTLRFRCTVTSDDPHPIRLRWQRADGDGPERVREDPEPATVHELVVWFLEPDADYAVVAEATDGDLVGEGTLRSGELPDDATAELAVTGASSAPLVGANDPCTGRAYALIFDTVTGRPVWYQEVDPYGTIGLLNMVTFTADHTVLALTSSRVVEVELDGTERFSLEYGVDYTELLHHDLTKRDGYYWLLFQDPGNPVLDGFLVYDGAGERVAGWRARDHLPIPAYATGDWMHTNTIAVDDARRVLLSSYGQSAVLSIDGDWDGATFGDLRWSLAGTPWSELPQDWTVDWSQLDGADGFEHPHDVQRLADDALLMLDNAHGRGLRLALDEEQHHAAAVAAWATGEPDCGPQGTVATTSAGNVLVGCSDGALTEYRPDGAAVWQASPVCSGFPELVRATPLEGW